MKILLLISTLFISLQLYAGFGNSTGPFYPTTGKFLIIRVDKDKDFQDILNGNAKSKRWITLNKDQLKQVGISVGDTFQISKFADGKLSKYVIKENVRAIRIQNHWYGEVEGQPYFSTFYIFLNDGPLTLENAVQEGGADDVDGIAYNGTEFEFIESVTLRKDQLKEGLPPTKVITYDQMSLWEGSESSFYGDYLGKFIKGYDIKILNTPNSMHYCSSLEIMKDNKTFKKFELACDSGGC